MATTRKSIIGCFCFFFSLMTILPVNAADNHLTMKTGGVDDTSSRPSPQPSTDRFSIQVAAFPQLLLANKASSQLQKKGFDPFVRYEDTRGKGMWYRVYVGNFPSRNEAQQAAVKMLQKDVVDTYVLRKLRADGQAGLSDTPQKSLQSTADPRPQASVPASHPNGTMREAKETGIAKPLLAAAIVSPTATAASNADPKETEDPVEQKRPVRLLLLDAIRYSLEGNREISVGAYTPQQALADVEGAAAVFDPMVFADSTFRRDPNLDSSLVDIVTEDEGRTQVGIRKPLKTGGSLATYLETRYSDLNNATFERTYKNIIAPTVELRQPLLKNFGAKKQQAAIEISNYQVNISEEVFRQKVIEISNRVSKVYWKLFLSTALIKINQKNLDMAEEVYRREAVRLARGISQQLDVERAKSKAQSRRSTLLRSREQYRIAMDRLKLLMNWSHLTIDSDATVIPVQVPHTAHMDVDEKAAIETALSNRPELMKVQQELMIRQVDEDLSAHERLPNLDAFGRYSLSGYGDDFSSAGENIRLNDEDAWEVGIRFEYPIGNRSTKSLHRKKVLKRRQTKAQFKRLKDDIKLDVKQVLHGIETAQGEIDATRLAMAAAEKVVEGEFARFDIGQTTNVELLRAQDLFAVTSRSYIRAIANYNIAINELARAQGVLPNGVVLADARR